MRKLKVFSTGVILWDGGSRRVLMVNALQPNVLMLGKDGKNGDRKAIAIPAHVPHVRVLDNVIKDTHGRRLLSHNWDPFSLKEISSGDRIDTLVCFLDHHEIVLPDSGDPISIDASLRGGAQPADGDKTSLRWLASLDELVGEVMEVDPKYLDDKDPTQDVAAFMRLRSGTATTNVIPANFMFKVIKGDDPTKLIDGRLDRCLGVVIRFEIPVDDGAVTIRFRHYDDSMSVFSGEDLVVDPNAEAESKSFTLTFKEDTADKNLWLLAGLSSLEDVLQLPSVDRSVGDADFHFRLIYRLARKKLSDKELLDHEVVLPIGRTLDGKPIPPDLRPLGAPRCAPAITNPDIPPSQ